MKNFLSKNWKKIVYVLCGIAIAVNLIIVFSTPANMVEEYYKYGPQVGRDVIDGSISVSGEGIKDAANDGVDNLTEFAQDVTGYNDSNAKVIVIVSLIVCAVLIISNIIDDSSSSADKKKK